MEKLRAYLEDLEDGEEYREELRKYEEENGVSRERMDSADSKVAELEAELVAVREELAKVKSHNYDLMRVAQLEAGAVEEAVEALADEVEEEIVDVEDLFVEKEEIVIE